MNKFRKILGFAAVLLMGLTSFAQSSNADKVIAIVGDNIILNSEVEIQYYQQLQNAAGAPLGEDVRCRILDNLMLDKMFLAQANLDSLTVSQDEIDGELDRRVKYFMSMFGSKEKMEEYYGKSVLEMKEDFTDDIKNQLLSDKMKGKIFTGLKVSVFLEVEGVGHYLPAYAGNLDIMTSAALKTAEKIALRMSEGAVA